jgi:hypothetical protein
MGGGDKNRQDGNPIRIAKKSKKIRQDNQQQQILKIEVVECVPPMGLTGALIAAGVRAAAHSREQRMSKHTFLTARVVRRAGAAGAVCRTGETLDRLGRADDELFGPPQPRVLLLEQ